MWFVLDLVVVVCLVVNVVRCVVVWLRCGGFVLVWIGVWVGWLLDSGFVGYVFYVWIGCWCGR